MESSSRYPPIDTTVLDKPTHPDFARALFEEAQDLKPTPVATSDGTLEATVPSFGGATVEAAREGFDLSIEIGAFAPASCRVERGVFGLGAFAQSVAESYLFSHEAYELKYAFAGARDGLAMVVVHGQYLEDTRQADARRTGFFKSVVVGQGELLIACQHDQFGYRETLERVALGLAASVRLAPSTEKPLLPLVRRDVFGLERDRQILGVQEVVIRSDDEDFRQTWIRTTELAMRGGQQLFARDAIETIDSDPDGYLTSQTFRERENGKLVSELVLEEAPMPGYSVRGSVHGRAVEATFRVKDGLRGPPGSAAVRRGREPHAVFLPSLSPSAPVVCELVESPEGVDLRCGGRTIMSGELAEDGFWSRAHRWDGALITR